MLCVITVTRAEILRRRVEGKGFNYTKGALIEKLATIRDGWIIHNLKKADRLLEESDDEQEKCWKSRLH